MTIAEVGVASPDRAFEAVAVRGAQRAAGRVRSASLKQTIEGVIDGLEDGGRRGGDCRRRRR